MDEDFGKVLLIVNLTMDDRDQTIKNIKQLKRLANKYNSGGEEDQGLAAYGQFTYDVQGGDDMTNKKIAQELVKMKLITPEPLTATTLRFLEKVSSSMILNILYQVDVNGGEMCNLYKFLKRQSPLFNHSKGRAARINEHYYKVSSLKT